MATPKELLRDLARDTLTYLKENHSLNESVLLDKTLPKVEIKPSIPASPLPVTVPPQPPVRAKTPPPKPPIQEEKKVLKEAPAPSKTLDRHPPPPSVVTEALRQLAPHLFTEAPIPDDSLAQKKRGAWKEKKLAEEVTLLSFKPESLSHQFLQNLSLAIRSCIRPSIVTLAPLIEKENRWDLFFESSSLKHLLAFPIPFDSFPNLLRYYKENPTTKQTFLHTTPLIVLRHFSDFQTDPHLKKELWKELSSHLSSPQSS